MAQAQLHTRSVEILFGRAVAHSLRPLCAATVGCMERHPMNESGEPNMGNPSVRFDEGRARVGHWPVCLSIHPFPPTPPKQGLLSCVTNWPITNSQLVTRGAAAFEWRGID